MNLGNRHSQHSFAQVPSANTPRSKFDRSFARKDTFNFDYLTPFFLDEILPGDTINLNVKTFMRLAPQVRPIMDNMMLDFYFFFVPNRLVWDHWEQFNGAVDNPIIVPTDYLIPTITYPGTGFDVGSIFDKFGLPTEVTQVSGSHHITALPFRAYNLIWNEWFRDQNFDAPLTFVTGDGPDSYVNYDLVRGNKKHDYFSSALPWPQKGDAVTMPLGTSAPIVRVDNALSWKAYQTATNTPSVNNTLVTSGGSVFVNSSTGTSFDPNGGLEADLSEATAASINLFRQAMMMQSFLELDARGGTRYVEILKSHFNVISPDFRLQRPEHLSSTTISINQHPIAQSSETGTSPQGNLAAFSTAQETGRRIGFSKSFVEHGYVIGLVKARAELTYQQGMNRLWTRQTREDFFWPKFQELGEQAILNQEIFFSANETVDTTPWGYNERHGEYRYRPSEITGQFRSTFAQSLDVWHLSEEFASLPTLNGTFMKSNTPIERALVVPDEDYPDILADYWFDYKHVRPMVAYPVPASLGRF